MAKIYTSADQLIGKTPLLELTHIEKEYALPARLIAKVESFNPAGSIKDRVALSMIETAEAEGKLIEIGRTVKDNALIVGGKLVMHTVGENLL